MGARNTMRHQYITHPNSKTQLGKTPILQLGAEGIRLLPPGARFLLDQITPDTAPYPQP